MILNPGVIKNLLTKNGRRPNRKQSKFNFHHLRNRSEPERAPSLVLKLNKTYIRFFYVISWYWGGVIL